jgi:deferrochelatase/peroxidase EfeB
VLQACADRQIVVEHAIRDLARLGRSAVSLRWQRAGFNEPPTVPTPGTPRNLLGFKDGTANLDATDAAQMRRNVWVAETDGPDWMIGGTYMVYREVRLHIEDWDDSPLEEQQDTFGRYKVSGAPYGGRNESDAVDVTKLPVDSHVRLANPRTGQGSEDERILRRGYNFHDGFDPAVGSYRSGLAFVGYQRDPRRQFVTIQQRLAASDALNEYAVHTASGVFAVPPGVARGDFVGSRLFA